LNFIGGNDKPLVGQPETSTMSTYEDVSLTAHGQDNNPLLKKSMLFKLGEPTLSAQTVVIDNGTYSTKIGNTDMDTPSHVLRTIVGKNNQVGELSNEIPKIFPIRDRIICDFDAMEKIWSHSFKALKCKTNESRVILTESIQNPKGVREQMTVTMIEKFSVDGLHIGSSSIFSLFSTGRTSGIVLDSGYGGSDVVSAFEGYALPHTITKSSIGGEDLTMYLENMLKKHDSTIDTKSVQEIKKTLCYVAQDYDQEALMFDQSTDLNKNFTLPDGNTITIGKELIKCPEVLFNPELIDRQTPGVNKAVEDAVQKLDMDIRTDLWANIILSGGTCMFKGLCNRMTKDLQSKFHYQSVRTHQAERYSQWIGGAILGSLSSFDKWITKVSQLFSMILL
jgi:actin